MKKTHLLLLAFAAIILASCGGHSPLKLSEREILKQCNNDLVKSGSDSAIVVIPTGYFEVENQGIRCTLEKLQAAGVINYEVERFAWWEKIKEKKTTPHTVTKYYWGYPYTETEYITKWVTRYEFNEHFMANVTLTEAAKKYALDHIPTSKLEEIEDKDMVQPVYYDSLYPENAVTCIENWPEIPHPLTNEVYKQCKALLAEAEALLAESTYTKAEQKLKSIRRVDNFDCMTIAQTAEINAEMDRISGLIDQKKGDEAYEKSKKIIEEASDLLNAAKDCKALDKVSNKMNSLDHVANNTLMSETQKADIDSLTRQVNNNIGTKKEEFGCNPNTPEEPQTIEEEVVPADNRDPQAIAYENAKRNEDGKTTILFAYLRKAIVARNIALMCGEKGTTASAEVIYKIKKVTDAERVLEGAINDYKTKATVTFTYYSDKGWVLDEGSQSKSASNQFDE